MMSSMNHILITRPEPQAELTALALKEAGFEVTLAPSITLRALPDAAIRVGALNHQVDGVVVTSQFALQVLDSNGLNRDVPLYVTGEILYNLALDYGFTHVRHGGGNAQGLLAMLLNQHQLKRQLLTITHGNHSAFDMATALQDAGFRVGKQALYHSKTMRTLPPEAINIIKKNQISAVLFYSAFTAKSFVKLTEEAGLIEHLKHMSAVGISENVMEALTASMWKTRLSTHSPAQLDVIHTLQMLLTPACV